MLLLPRSSQDAKQAFDIRPQGRNEVSVMLEVLSSNYTTRAIAESDIDDVNIFIYSDTGGLITRRHASGGFAQIDMPGRYSIYVTQRTYIGIWGLSHGLSHMP